MSKDVIIGFMKHHRLAVALGALALIFAAVLFFGLPRVGELEQELEQERTAFRRMQQNMTQGAELREHLDTLRSQLAHVDNRLMERREVAVNYDYFYRLEEASGVRIQNIQQHGQAIGAAVTLPNADLFDTIGYSISAQGGFNEVVDFVQRLEAGDHFVRIQSINIGRSAAEGDAGRLTAQVEFNVLGRKP